MKLDRTLKVVIRERAQGEPEEAPPAPRSPLTMAAFGSAALGLVASGITSSPEYAMVGILGAMACLQMGTRKSRYAAPSFETVTRKVRVEIGDAGVKVVGDPLIPKEDIAQAYFQPRGKAPPTVRCIDRHDAVVFEAEVADEADGKELLQALGAETMQRRAAFKVASPWFNGGAAGAMILFMFALSVLLLAATSWAKSWWPLVPLAILLTLASTLALPQTVDVGIDGVYCRWPMWNRFIPFEEIASVTVSNFDVVLNLTDGRKEPLHAARAKVMGRQAALVRDALAARIEEARQAHQQAARATELAALVGRGTRPVAEWRKELTRLHDPDRGGGYRDAASRGEDLWRVVEDTSAPEDARAGAAIALRNEEGARTRIRVAADTVASPKLRVALERAAAAEIEEEELDDALEAFAQDGE